MSDSEFPGCGCGCNPGPPPVHDHRCCLDQGFWEPHPDCPGLLPDGKWVDWREVETLVRQNEQAAWINTMLNQPERER